MLSGTLRVEFVESSLFSVSPGVSSDKSESLLASHSGLGVGSD